MAFTNVPLRRSAALGLAAALLGYLPAFALATLRRSAILALELPGELRDPAPMREVFEPGTATVAGWLWYDAHLVPASLPTTDVFAGRAALTNVNLLNALGGVALLLYLVPPALLVAAGYAFVRSGGITLAMAPSGGASVAVGYTPAMVLGAFLPTASATTPGGTAVVASPAGIPVIVAGLAYPLIFGALGGVLAKRRVEATDGSEPRGGTPAERA
ncbi:hypothetical protein [Halorarum salinum]|uniref:DUF7978 domain-containing protein n=1 Tax=Halorarum salinum TaxID=2743089 RepID=A0A7D5Q959_9EURY|nr:hypothetical protein [Halobaculum salinum]QLG61516.1 hypothetical protein HUG12_07160 [Halobaculum salinum]